LLKAERVKSLHPEEQKISSSFETALRPKARIYNWTAFAVGPPQDEEIFASRRIEGVNGYSVD